VLLVRAADIESIKLYGRLCVDLVWWMENAAGRGIYTTVLVQGDTLRRWARIGAPLPQSHLRA